MPDDTRRPRVVIVGSGFGGLACARRLNRQPVDVILLDQHNYHLFTPLLYQVATGLLNPAAIAYPLRTVLRHSPNGRFQQATVAGVDLAGKTVRVRGGPHIPYDYLVLATGSTDNYFANQEIADVSLGVKVLADATGLRNHVLTCLERADAESNLDVRRALLTFVIVGGGPTGVECSGALAELMQIVAGKDYHQISRSEIRIVLVEGLPRLLNAFSEHLGRYAQRVLERRGVEVRTTALVKTADEHGVALSDGTLIPCRTIIWSAGVRPNDPIGEPSPPRFRNRRIKVDAQLRIPGAAGAYAIGDVASPELDDQRELPMLSPPAMQAGRYVAAAILAAIRGEPRQRAPLPDRIPQSTQRPGLLGLGLPAARPADPHHPGDRRRAGAGAQCRQRLSPQSGLMRYLAFATDYDGTLAHHGVVDGETVDALRR